MAGDHFPNMPYPKGVGFFIPNLFSPWRHQIPILGKVDFWDRPTLTWRSLLGAMDTCVAGVHFPNMPYPKGTCQSQEEALNQPQEDTTNWEVLLLTGHLLLDGIYYYGVAFCSSVAQEYYVELYYYSFGHSNSAILSSIPSDAWATYGITFTFGLLLGLISGLGIITVLSKVTKVRAPASFCYLYHSISIGRKPYFCGVCSKPVSGVLFYLSTGHRILAELQLGLWIYIYIYIYIDVNICVHNLRTHHLGM